MATVATSGDAALAAAIGRLAAMPAFVQSALERLAPGAFATRPGPDEWAFVEQACHLRDVERDAFLVRVRRMLAETLPDLEPFFGDAVARERDYLAQDARGATRDFTAARAELVALLRSIAPADLDRPATFAGRRITLRDLVAMIDEHDREHRAQVEALVGRIATG
jgi:hypothetical protein